MYKLDFTDEGRGTLALVDKKIGQRILDKLKWLCEHVADIVQLPLAGKLSGLYKLRIGDWRAIYEIDHLHKVITVHRVGHRREIYK